MGWITVLCMAAMVLVTVWWIYILVATENKIKDLLGEEEELTPEEFLQLRKAKFSGNKYMSTRYDVPGVYIIYNYTKDMYYVGQAKHLFSRVNQHFTGHGNGDVYADYKYGDEFTIRMLSLDNSGYSSLNKLEKDTIAAYNAYNKGYNKTRGNRG